MSPPKYGSPPLYSGPPPNWSPPPYWGQTHHWGQPNREGSLYHNYDNLGSFPHKDHPHGNLPHGFKPHGPACSERPNESQTPSLSVKKENTEIITPSAAIDVSPTPNSILNIFNRNPNQPNKMGSADTVVASVERSTITPIDVTPVSPISNSITNFFNQRPNEPSVVPLLESLLENDGTITTTIVNDILKRNQNPNQPNEMGSADAVSIENDQTEIITTTDATATTNSIPHIFYEKSNKPNEIGFAGNGVPSVESSTNVFIENNDDAPVTSTDRTAVSPTSNSEANIFNKNSNHPNELESADTVVPSIQSSTAVLIEKDYSEIITPTDATTVSPAPNIMSENGMKS